METFTIAQLLTQQPRLSALPMHQIWAECVFQGKNIENRNRHCHKRGTILIYACVTQKGLGDSLLFLSRNDGGRSLLREGLTLHFGALLGAVDIIACTDNTHSDQGVGNWGMPRLWHWHLSNPCRLVEPIAYRPRSQGWFVVTAEKLAEQQKLGVRMLTDDASH